MRLKVLEKYDNSCSSDFVCLDEDGKKIIVDIFVDGTIPKEYTQENIVGCTIECDWMHAYISIAHGVRVLNESTN